MKGIIEQRRPQNRLFDCYIEFRGKYASYVKYLKNELALFSTYREIYVISSILGFVMRRKNTEEIETSEEKANIFPDDLATHMSELKLIYRIIMLLDSPDIEQSKDRAFKDDPQYGEDALLRQNMELFNSYVCGGLEYLYTYFRMDNTDDISEKVNRLYSLFYETANSCGLIRDNEIDSVINNN